MQPSTHGCDAVASIANVGNRNTPVRRRLHNLRYRGRYGPKRSKAESHLERLFFIFAQIRADFYGGVIRTKFVSLCLFARTSYFLHTSLKMDEFKLTERKLT